MVIAEVMRRGGIWVYLEDTVHFLMDYMWDMRGREESKRLQLSSRALLLFKTGELSVVRAGKGKDLELCV